MDLNNNEKGREFGQEDVSTSDSNEKHCFNRYRQGIDDGSLQRSPAYGDRVGDGPLPNSNRRTGKNQAGTEA